MQPSNDTFVIKTKNDISDSDLVIFQTVDGKVFIGYNMGICQDFIHVYSIYQVHSDDLSDPLKTKFFPYMFGMSSGVWRFSRSQILMISEASKILISLFGDCIVEHSKMVFIKKSGGTANILKNIPIDSPAFDEAAELVDGNQTGTKH